MEVGNADVVTTMAAGFAQTLEKLSAIRTTACGSSHYPDLSYFTYRPENRCSHRVVSMGHGTRLTPPRAMES